ncbi:MAG: hypothetical protein ABI365_07805, partial [Lysobacteraceae bacterium]
MNMIRAIEAVAHFVYTDRFSHLLDLGAEAVGGILARERMIGQVELHHAAAKFAELFVLRGHLHARRDRRRA